MDVCFDRDSTSIHVHSLLSLSGMIQNVHYARSVNARPLFVHMACKLNDKEKCTQCVHVYIASWVVVHMSFTCPSRVHATEALQAKRMIHG